MTERVFPLLVCLALAAALTACGAGTPDAVSQLAPVTPPPAVTQPAPASAPAEATPSSAGIHGTLQQTGITAAPSGVYTPEALGEGMRVLWTVSGYVLGPGFSGDKQAAEAMLFKPLDINETQIIFDGQTCEAGSFQEETVNAAEYLSSVWHVTPPDLGIDVQELQVFKTQCSLPGFREYMRLGDGRLIVPINGVFYFFEPARNN